MKFSSFKHSGSETEILPLGDTRARIGPKMRSPRLLLMGGLPSLFPLLGLATGPHPLAIAITKPWHLYTQLKTQARPEQLKLSKTDPSTWP
jgi:hypothetical protein